MTEPVPGTAVVHVPKPAPKVGDVNEWGRKFDSYHWVLENEPDDRIPDSYEGSPIPPNKYCRGWNPKEMRQKYCRNPAGKETDHPGRGRCKHHGGNSAATHGLDTRASRQERNGRKGYRSVEPTVQALIEEQEEKGNTLEILQEIQLTRALFQKYLDKNAEPDPDVVLKFVSEITRMVERVFTIRSKFSITFEELQRFVYMAVQRIDYRVRNAVTDPKQADALIKKINGDLRGIRP